MKRQAGEIYYCPRCRGVWLDRDELDKIIKSGSEQVDLPNRAPHSGFFKSAAHAMGKERHVSRKKSWFWQLFD